MYHISIIICEIKSVENIGDIHLVIRLLTIGLNLQPEFHVLLAELSLQKFLQ